MANISQYLNKIKKAVYGEEVRGSIYDAINAMNGNLTYFQGVVDSEHDYNQSQVTRLDGRIDELASGQPTPVGLVADMEDTSVVYLYTGSEQGYSAGHFYYYDSVNEAWVDGGEYAAGISVYLNENTLIIQASDLDNSSSTSESSVNIEKIQIDHVVHNIMPSNELTDDQIIQSNIRKCLRSATAIQQMGYHEVIDGKNKTGHMNKGAVITGIPYSSVVWNESDILWNRTPASYYSAMLNPASIVYQGNIWEILYNDSNTHTAAQGNYYGSMCSGLAGKTLGCDVYYTTREMIYMPDRVRTFDFTGANDVKIGTTFVFWASSQSDELETEESAGSGHAMVVYDVSRDDNGKVTRLAIAEEAKPCARLTYYTPADFEKRIRKDGYAPCEYIGVKPKLLPEVHYATDIIPEFGDRTWYRVGDEIWAYIPSAADITKIYYKTLAASTYSEVALSSLTTKTVTLPDSSTVTVYDLQPYATTAGEYCFTTDPEFNDPCMISVVNTGAVSIANVSGSRESTAYISGYSSNLTPLWYSVNYLVPSSDYSKYSYPYPAPEGYVSKTDTTNKYALNGATSFTFEKPFKNEMFVESSVIQDYAGYVVQVWFENIFGMPCAWNYVIESYVAPEENS